MANDEIKINSDRLWSDLTELGRIGKQPHGGLSRTALSEADQQARQWFVEKIKAAGLNVRIDAALNVIGTLKTETPKTRKIAAIGSHLDTVANGGMFDGALGVVAALECARTIMEHGVRLPWDLEIISFCDEEAAHHAGTIGSRAMIGLLRDGEIFQTNQKGAGSFARDMELLGVDPHLIKEARRNPDDFCLFLELHIEQGPRLENENLNIGVVTSITGIYRYLVTVPGVAAHAGTTPMTMRQDALVAAAPVFTLLPEWVQKQNPEMVGTIGIVEIVPGATNVIPGECRFLIELRSQHPEDRKAVIDRLHSYAADKDDWKIEVVYEKDSVGLSPLLMEQIGNAADKEELAWTRMASGAGHDAQSFARFVPTGMIFVPCRDGVSHNPAEWISPGDASNGCRILLRTLLESAKNNLLIE